MKFSEFAAIGLWLVSGFFWLMAALMDFQLGAEILEKFPTLGLLALQLNAYAAFAACAAAISQAISAKS